MAQGRSNLVGRAFMGRLALLPDRMRRGLGVLVFGIGVLAFLQLGPVGNTIAPFGLDYASAWPGILLGGFGWWIAFVPNDHGGDPDKVSWGWRVPARAMLAIGTAWVVGEALWLLPALSNGAYTTRAYTTWGVGFLIFIAAIFGRMVDAIHVRSRWPLRAMIGGICLIWMGAVDTDKVYHSGGVGLAAAAEQATMDDAWYEHFQARIDGLKGDGPAVLVAASGGGSRAALFASLTYEALEKVPLDQDDPASATFGDHIVAISSVSGGSLASGYYLHSISTTGELPRRPTWLRSDLDALTVAMRSESARLVARARERFGKSEFTEHFAAVDAELAAWPGIPLAEAPWLRESAFADDMTTDFMAAVLRATIEPGLSRGGSITRLWNQRFGLGQISSAPGAFLKAPLVFFNSTEVQSGRRFVVGFPRMPHRLLGNSAGNLSDIEGLQWVTGAEAVRLSANFPWGFEVAGLAPSLGGAQVELLDGGIVDNTGIDTFTILFEHLALEAGEGGAYPQDATPLRQEKARRLLASLRKRGVLLVEIDAGARPGDTAGLAALLPAFTSPLQALSAASANNAFEARDQNVDRIRDVINWDGHAAQFLHLTWVCNRLDNVQTAWSLGTADKAVTILQFLAEQRRLAPILARVELERETPGSQVDLQSAIDDETHATRAFHVQAASSPEVDDALRLVVGGRLNEVINVKAGRTGTTAAGEPPPPPRRATAVSLPPPPPAPSAEDVLNELEAAAGSDPDAKKAVDALRKAAGAVKAGKVALPETGGVLPSSVAVPPTKDLFDAAGAFGKKLEKKKKKKDDKKDVK